jgi:phosphoserine phosphatase RsbU/P
VGRCAAVLAALRELAAAEPDLVNLAIEMDTRITKDMEIEDLVTSSWPTSRRAMFRTVNCGHHPPLRLPAGSAELQLMTPAQPAPLLGLRPRPARQANCLRHP